MAIAASLLSTPYLSLAGKLLVGVSLKISLGMIILSRSFIICRTCIRLKPALDEGCGSVLAAMPPQTADLSTILPAERHLWTSTGTKLLHYSSHHRLSYRNLISQPKSSLYVRFALYKLASAIS